MVSSKSSAMPERSSISPMKVKNGIASRVSFCMMPNMRSGKLCKNSKRNKSSSMLMKPKNKPQAASEKATE